VKRGDLIIVSAPGDYGKPRPAIVVQSDRLVTDSILVAQITSEIIVAPFHRLTVEPGPATGLHTTSQIMTDKIVTLRRSKCGRVIGRLDEAALIALNRMLSTVLGLADGPEPPRYRPPRYGKPRFGS
jgi:mRNA interferase MazF